MVLQDFTTQELLAELERRSLEKIRRESGRQAYRYIKLLKRLGPPKKVKLSSFISLHYMYCGTLDVQEDIEAIEDYYGVERGYLNIEK